ncbi:methionine-rich copper-binding protein CopC [Arthrobacter sp. V1I9]|uniref:copper resistance CopC family protein n=1 Tax=Arthrobacter sp. V1I9 TaxID=3042275 RepID=UPI0027933A47|nr:copper resistance CopC family protein [Arthrobacter sp. V1I9]MDQ0871084.1 methionine-rich copper-binding protein CopC [Arthrobacter sp. V1I9]
MNRQGWLGFADVAARCVAARRLRGAARGLALTFLLAFLFFFPLAPAAAHDAIESFAPAEGAVVAEAPAAVKLTFNNTPIALGAAVQVTDGSGTDQAEGPVVITDNVASQAVKTSAPAGRYTVTWRVVSSDSHPIEGQYTFIAGDSPGSSSSLAAVPAAPSTPASETALPVATTWALVASGAVAVASLLLMDWYVRLRLPRGSGSPS